MFVFYGSFMTRHAPYSQVINVTFSCANQIGKSLFWRKAPAFFCTYSHFRFLINSPLRKALNLPQKCTRAKRHQLCRKCVKDNACIGKKFAFSTTQNWVIFGILYKECPACKASLTNPKHAFLSRCILPVTDFSSRQPPFHLQEHTAFLICSACKFHPGNGKFFDLYHCAIFTICK